MRILAAGMTVFAALALAGCGAKPDLDIMAKSCGGKGAGLSFTRTWLLIDEDTTRDAVGCVLPKIYPNQADRDALAHLQRGPADRAVIGGRSVEVGTVDDLPWMRIGK